MTKKPLTTYRVEDSAHYYAYQVDDERGTIYIVSRSGVDIGDTTSKEIAQQLCRKQT